MVFGARCTCSCIIKITTFVSHEENGWENDELND